MPGCSNDHSGLDYVWLNMHSTVTGMEGRSTRWRITAVYGKWIETNKIIFILAFPKFSFILNKKCFSSHFTH